MGGRALGRGEGRMSVIGVTGGFTHAQVYVVQNHVYIRIQQYIPMQISVSTPILSIPPSFPLYPYLLPLHSLCIHCNAYPPSNLYTSIHHTPHPPTHVPIIPTLTRHPRPSILHLPLSPSCSIHEAPSARKGGASPTPREALHILMSEGCATREDRSRRKLASDKT